MTSSKNSSSETSHNQSQPSLPIIHGIQDESKRREEVYLSRPESESNTEQRQQGSVLFRQLEVVKAT